MLLNFLTKKLLCDPVSRIMSSGGNFCRRLKQFFHQPVLKLAHHARRVHGSLNRCRLAGGLFVLAIVLAAYQAGVLLERSHTISARDLLVHAQARAMDAQQLKINQTRLLARELGIMQARIMRLEVLGQRLIDSQNLDEEFDFSHQPGVGGGSLLLPQAPLHSDELSTTMQQLKPRAERLEMQLTMLGDFINHSELQLAMMTKTWPVRRGWISSRFGQRHSPFTGALEMHHGIDIVAGEGAPIKAVAGGVVRMAKRSPDYGNVIEVDHGNGYSTLYAHNKVNLVQEGDLVQQGDIIATLGNTGRSTGRHLHFEVLKHGQPIDPQTYLKRP